MLTIVSTMIVCRSGAGETFSSVGTCPNTTCSDFVLSALPVVLLTMSAPSHIPWTSSHPFLRADNPSAFEDAYWSVDYLRTYTDGAGAQLSTRAAVVGVVTAMLVASLQML